MNQILINVTDTENKRTWFEQESYGFKSGTIGKFGRSELHRSSNPILSKMAEKIYRQLHSAEKSYDKINEWWVNYLQDIYKLEISLANGESISNLPELKDINGNVKPFSGQIPQIAIEPIYNNQGTVLMGDSFVSNGNGSNAQNSDALKEDHDVKILSRVGENKTTVTDDGNTNKVKDDILKSVDTNPDVTSENKTTVTDDGSANEVRDDINKTTGNNPNVTGNNNTSSDIPKQDIKFLEKVDVAKKVWLGDFGNGEERIKKLTELGYNYDEIQEIVNLGLKKVFEYDTSSVSGNNSGSKPTLNAFETDNILDNTENVNVVKPQTNTTNTQTNTNTTTTNTTATNQTASASGLISDKLLDSLVKSGETINGKAGVEYYHKIEAQLNKDSIPTNYRTQIENAIGAFDVYHDKNAMLVVKSDLEYVGVFADLSKHKIGDKVPTARGMGIVIGASDAASKSTEDLFEIPVYRNDGN